MAYIARLQDVIKKLHGCESSYDRSARVREVFQGKIVWSGEVEIFKLKDHPKAQECYAWSYLDDEGKEHFTAVLKLRPVDSPEKALRAAIRAQMKEEAKKT
jgi:hypothetical protein